MDASKVDLPRIDKNVEFVGVSRLRTLNATNLHDLDTTLVIQDPNNKPIAVVISFGLFMAMQDERDRALSTLEMVMSREESTALRNGMQDVLSKKTKPISAVRDAVRKKVRR